MNITWYRFRHKWSSGYSTWEEKHIGGVYTIEELEEVIGLECEDNNWSEHYRGFDLEILTRPSDEYINRVKQCATNALEYNTRLLEFLNTMQHAQQLIQHTPTWHNYESDINVVIGFAQQFKCTDDVGAAIKRIKAAQRKGLQGYSVHE